MLLKAENVSKLKKLKNTKGFALAVMGLLAGILFLLIPAETEEETEGYKALSDMPSAEYCAILEEKAETLIKELPEVDDCSVFITLQSGYQYVYATDQHVREGENTKETDKTIVLAGNGNGEAPILIQETMPKIAGVAVVCGGASYETQYRIVELMCALFDIESHRISVQT